MNTIHYLNVLDDPDENQKKIRKLLNQVVVRRSQIVDEWLAASELEDGSELFWTMKGTTKPGYPPLRELCKFLEKGARILCNRVTSL